MFKKIREQQSCFLFDDIFVNAILED